MSMLDFLFKSQIEKAVRAQLSIAETENNFTVGARSANQSTRDRYSWDGTQIIKDSIQTEFSLLLKSLLYFKEPMDMNGRLTLATADPVPSAEISSSSSLFFTPFRGNRISLYVPDYGWRVYSFSELSLDISGFTSGRNYDIFLYDNAGTLTLEGLVWSNDTLRAANLYSLNGRWVKNGAYDRLYLGTIRMNGAGVSADTLKARLVWNNYNRVQRPFYIFDSTDTWTYATSAYRQWNNSTSNQVAFVVGIPEDPINLVFYAMARNNGEALSAVLGIGLDHVNSNDANFFTFYHGPTQIITSGHATYFNIPPLGYHYLALIEYSSGGTTIFIGDNGDPSIQKSGAIGWIMS